VVLEVLGTGLVGRELGERVLDHPQGGVGLGELGAQLGDLGHGDPAVVDGVDRLGLLDLRGHLIDDRCFLFSVQRVSYLRNEMSPLAGGLGKMGLRGFACTGLMENLPVVWG
jgi:hypothetical protein